VEGVFGLADVNMSSTQDAPAPVVEYSAGSTAAAPTTSLWGISSLQWKSGIAAWLGWLFDGLDMHLYALVATPFVAELLNAASTSDRNVNQKSSIIQAAFLVGWALGGGFFGRLGDLIGRSRALGLTILVYAFFTGLSFLAQTWWQLMIFRFVAALGIGGEWAVGSSLLSETWPARLRPWLAAILQTGVNIGVLLACAVTGLMAGLPYRFVFLAGIVPAFLVVWIRRSVPEPHEWQAARAANRNQAPKISGLFEGEVRRITIFTILVCASSLTAWWAFMFWVLQHVRSLPDVAGWTAAEKTRLASLTFFLMIGVSIGGNFFAGALARIVGYRWGICLMFVGFFAAMFGTFIVPRDHVQMLWWAPAVGFFSGVFGLFTMYLPPLFPTLLRTTGAGFCYNIGRLAAAGGTIFFGAFAKVGKGTNDLRLALLYASFLFIPAIIGALFLPELHDRKVANG
jgi:predicted MFS family arabinose efflux permease